MYSFWKVWINAKAEHHARRVLERVQRALGREAVDHAIEPYPKTRGFLERFRMELRSEGWNDCVIEVIELGQRVGRGWILSGDILSDPSGWSNQPSIPGVTAIEWNLVPEVRPTTSEAVSP